MQPQTNPTQNPQPPKNYRKIVSKLLSLWRIEIIAIITLVTIPFLANGNFDIRRFAWTGFSVNTQSLQNLRQTTQPNVQALPEDPPYKQIFLDLTNLFVDAEVQEISDPANDISGFARMKYDENTSKTYVFARIENLPSFQHSILRVWAVYQDEYKPVGLAQFAKEQNKPVAYIVLTQPGDMHIYDSLIFSYDPSLNVTQPNLPIITLGI